MLILKLHGQHEIGKYGKNLQILMQLKFSTKKYKSTVH